MTTVATAQGARSQLLAKAQSALGTPATGNFSRVRYNTHSLDVVKQSIEGAEIRSDRQVQDYRHGNRNSAGDIVCDLCYADHDLFISSAMFSSYVTDQMSIGIVPSYLSIEDGALDIAQYRMYIDMLVNSMQVSMAPNQMVRATFGLVGTDGNANAGSSSGGTPVAASNNKPFDSFNAALYDNAAESGAEIAVATSLEFTIDNGVRPAFVIGQQTPLNLEYGRGRVTGRLTAYYKDAVLITRFLNETEGVLVVNIVDPDGNDMEFRFPRIKYNGATVPVANEQGRVITIPFVALRDSSLGTALKITR